MYLKKFYGVSSILSFFLILLSSFSSFAGISYMEIYFTQDGGGIPDPTRVEFLKLCMNCNVSYANIEELAQLNVNSGSCGGPMMVGNVGTDPCATGSPMQPGWFSDNGSDYYFFDGNSWSFSTTPISNAINVSWSLTSNDLPTTSGNVIGMPNTVTGATHRDYTSSNGRRARYWGLTSSRDPNYYYECIISPSAGYDLSIGSISFEKGNSRGGTRYMDIYYSFDGFSSETVLGSNIILPNYTTNSADYANINLSVNDGSSLSIRFYFYDLSSYYSYLKNISLNGYATVATPSNTAPSIDSPIAANVEENLSTVMTVLATDPEGDNISYSITGGVDQALFTIDATTGVLTFSSAPNFETPVDNGSDNVYNVQVTATDDGAGNLTDSKDIAITVTNSSSESISTSGGGVNWSDGSTWTDGIPSDGDNVTISHDMMVDAGTNNLGSLTIDASKTLTVNTGQTLTTSGAIDVNGTLTISGTGS